jgi:hypothetical protein
MRSSLGIVAVSVLTIVVACCTAAARADDSKIVRHIRWSEEKAAGHLAAGEVIDEPGKIPPEQLVVRQSGDPSKSLHILTIDEPRVAPPAYVLRGRVRYEGVKKPGYLELLNYLPDGGPYFTRTLSPSGPMQVLEGGSEWREFQLPFDLAKPDGGYYVGPTKLELNVSLPGGGTVYLSDLELAQLRSGADLSGGAWWSGRTSGIMGAVVGIVLGCFGGLIGRLEGYGKARAVVMAALVVLFITGIASLIACIVAVSLGQPYAVYSLFLIGGVLGTVLPPLRLRDLRRRYQELELRRMEALDVG